MIRMTRVRRQGTGAFVAALLCLCLWLCPAVAEQLPETVTGMFDERKYIRISPEANTSVVAWVPPGTPLEMHPVSDRYAEVTYNDVTGFIYYLDMMPVDGTGVAQSGMAQGEDVKILAAPTASEDEPVVIFTAYATEPRAALAQPVIGAEVAEVFAAYTPLSVVARNGDYMKVRARDGGYGYLLADELVELRTDAPVMEFEAYVDQPRVLYEIPLPGAKVVSILMPQTHVTVTGRNGEYACVSSGGETGYVLEAELIPMTPERGATQFGVVSITSVLYSAPDAQSFTEEYINAGTIVETDAQSNGFSRLRDSGLYIRTDALTRLAADEIAPRFGYWETDQALYMNTSGTLVPTGVVMRANTLTTVEWTLGGYYLLATEDGLGFVPQAGFEVISVSTPIAQPVAAYVAREVQLLSQPFSFSSPIGQSLPANTHLWLKEESGEYYRVEAEGRSGYISKAAIEVLGEDVALKGFEVYVGKSAPLLNFPSTDYGRQIALLPENILVKVLAENGRFYYVQNILGAGYLPKADVMAFEQAERPVQIGDQRYYLFLNKATRQLTIYYADAQGNRTDQVCRTVTVAIGKQTTPTPSGTFTLGAKERWHQFNPSFAPFAIQYTSGRYLHGPLYYSMTETSLNESRLEDFGTMATGGCLRMPYADALWIYFHCMEGTTLEIVSGV